MVKKLLAVLLLSLPVLIFGQTAEDFNRTVDFSLTLAELDRIAAVGGDLPNKYVIIEGAVASREVVNRDTENYLGELVLVAGEWIGVESVVRFECILQLVGPEYASAIPARRSRRANPAEITLDTRLLVVGKVVGVRKIEDGTIIPVLQAAAIRKIQ